MNIANKLTVIRLLSVPVFIIVMLLPESIIPLWIACLIGAALFIGASITDALDGHLARKHNLITDFGKFFDPLADKFMVIGALLVMLFRIERLSIYILIVAVVVIFRELAVTSARLVASTSNDKIVIPANMVGKVKTVFQIIFISSVLIEHALWADLIPSVLYGYPVSFLSMIGTLVLTVWSGAVYIKECWKYIDTNK